MSAQPPTFPVTGADADAKAALRREIVTPEGVPISFQLASVGDRGAALALDILILAAVLFLVSLVAGFAFGADMDRGSWLRPFIIIAAFLIFNFYFTFFELRWQGSTPGKRSVGIRVIDGRGGQLEPASVFARNLMRELEVWTPLRFLVASSTFWPTAPGWAKLLAGAWLGVCALMPLFNRDKLRPGDLIAGTKVVTAPKAVLLPDLAAEPAAATWQAGPAHATTAAAHEPFFAFTEAQLAVYGEYELQVLEGVLRGDDTLKRLQAIETVAEKIREKLRYEGKVPPARYEQFLREFYVALRTHLEKRRLFGQRKADKFSAS